MFGFARRSLLIIISLSVLSLTRADDTSSPSLAARTIDRLIDQRLESENVSAATRSSDAEFCRRVWFDIAGVAPSIAELRSFLEDTDPNKREQLVDRLLVSPQYANHMASRWNKILLPSDAQTEQGQQANVAALHRWLQSQFRDNVPYDYFVGGFLTAGGAGNAGPAIFYTSHSLEPEKLAAATSRIFMGIQLQCAQCHDHPFDRWTQEDFWQYAAFFSQLTQTDAQGGRDAMIEDRVGSEVMLPDTEQVMAPSYPGVDEPPEADPADIRRRQLTIWMASRDNPYFARAAVNRAWAHLFGRGLVDPVDAMDADNEPSHPELLDFLAKHFTKQRFNLRNLYATIARTEAYNRTSSVSQENAPADELFAAMLVKTLSAKQYYDSLQQNVFRRSSPSTSDRMSSDSATRQQFLNRMRSTGTTSREYPHGVVQALGMMNGPTVASATSPERLGLLAMLEAPMFDQSDRIETLYLATLSRFPREEEIARCAELFSGANTLPKQRESMSDLLWVLLNTAECAVCP